MRFAEISQDVQISRPVPRKLDLGLTPGRRKFNHFYKEALENLEEKDRDEARRMDIDFSLVYNLGPQFPAMRFKSEEADSFVKSLSDFLTNRIQKRRTLVNDLYAKQNNFRKQLVELDNSQKKLNSENQAKSAVLSREREKIQALESRVITYENSIDDLNRRLRDQNETICRLQEELNQKKYLLNQKEMEKEKQRQKYTTKIAVENEKMSRELELKLREQKSKLKDQMRLKDAKLKQMKDILNAENIDRNTGPILRSQDAEFHGPTPSHAQPTSVYHTPRPKGGVAVANPRHRRSKSAGEKWLAHTAAQPVPLGTVFQPYLPNRKSVTKLTEMKDVANAKTSKYCLISQTADTDGELETRLFKGDIIPTMTGGAQVVLNDVECLKQSSPIAPSPGRKRSSADRGNHELTQPEVAARCSIGIEGHYNKKPRI